MECSGVVALPGETGTATCGVERISAETQRSRGRSLGCLLRVCFDPTARQWRPCSSNWSPGLSVLGIVRLAWWIRPFGYWSDTSDSMLFLSTR